MAWLGFEVLSLFVWPRCLLSFFELGRWASLTIFSSLSPISCAILLQSSPALNFATMPSNLWPEALASKFAISNSPYPSSVDDFSVRSVAMGTPVSLDVFSRCLRENLTGVRISSVLWRGWNRARTVALLERCRESLTTQTPFLCEMRRGASCSGVYFKQYFKIALCSSSSRVKR